MALTGCGGGGFLLLVLVRRALRVECQRQSSNDSWNLRRISAGKQETWMSAQPALPMERIVPPWNCDAAAQVVAPRMATLHAATCAMPGCACPSLRSSPETVMRQTYRIERYAPKMARHTASSALAGP